MLAARSCASCASWNAPSAKLWLPKERLPGMSAQFDDGVERARRTSIESEIERRGITLRKSGAERIGPCPRCGGTDRFSVNPKLGVWNCRHCKAAYMPGDIIGWVQWLDGTEFVRAVETINQEPPPLNGHGHESGGSAPQQVAW